MKLFNWRALEDYCTTKSTSLLEVSSPRDFRLDNDTCGGSGQPCQGRQLSPRTLVEQMVGSSVQSTAEGLLDDQGPSDLSGVYAVPACEPWLNNGFCGIPSPPLNPGQVRGPSQGCSPDCAIPVPCGDGELEAWETRDDFGDRMLRASLEEVHALSGTPCSPTIRYESSVVPPAWSFSECLDVMMLVDGSDSSRLCVAHPPEGPTYMWIPDNFQMRSHMSTRFSGVEVLAHGPFPHDCCPHCQSYTCQDCTPPERQPARCFVPCPPVYAGLAKFRPVQQTVLCFSCTLGDTLGSALVAPMVWDFYLKAGKILVIFDPAWFAYFTPEVGQELSLIGAKCIGMSGETPIYKVFPEGLAFMVKAAPLREVGHDDLGRLTRHLELFAGIGGWTEAMELLDIPKHTVFLDNHPDKIRMLAERLRLPVFNIEELGPHLPESFILRANIQDLRWLKLTLWSAFDIVTFSSPCVSFSAGGRETGFQAPEGLLLLTTLGLVKLAKPRLAVGETLPPWHLVTCGSKSRPYDTIWTSLCPSWSCSFLAWFL